MSDLTPTQEDRRGDYVPCPLCKQYSHSIGEDQLAGAFNHFQSMFSHRGDGIPTQHSFDQRTRDAAQVLMAAARQSVQAAAEGGDARELLAALGGYASLDDFRRILGECRTSAERVGLLEVGEEVRRAIEVIDALSLSRPPAGEQEEIERLIEELLVVSLRPETSPLNRSMMQAAAARLSSSLTPKEA